MKQSSRPPVNSRHTVKAGVEIRHIQMNQGNSFSGTLTYTTLANFAANRLDQAQQTAMLPLKRLRKTQYFAYVEDEFKVRPNVTLNVGLRYQFFNVFYDVDNRSTSIPAAATARREANSAFPTHTISTPG